MLQKEVLSDDVKVIPVMVPECFDSRASKNIAYLNQVSLFGFPSLFSTFYLQVLQSNRNLYMYLVTEVLFAEDLHHHFPLVYVS